MCGEELSSGRSITNGGTSELGDLFVEIATCERAKRPCPADLWLRLTIWVLSCDLVLVVERWSFLKSEEGTVVQSVLDVFVLVATATIGSAE